MVAVFLENFGVLAGHKVAQDDPVTLDDLARKRLLADREAKPTRKSIDCARILLGSALDVELDGSSN